MLRLAVRLAALVNHEWPDSDDRVKLLELLGTLCRELHDLVNDTYFNYPV